MKRTEIQNKVIGKIIIKATLENTSPLLIGRRFGDEAEMEIIRLPDERVYIPASSFAGALANFYRNFVDEKNFSADELETITAIWGSDCKKGNSANEKSYQSHLNIDNLLPIEIKQKVSIRDGVKIDYQTNIAQNGGKYDYQVLEPGAAFCFKAEITIREGMAVSLVQRLTRFIYDAFTNEEFRLGALTNFGFGQFRCPDRKAWQFEFTRDATLWFAYLQKGIPDDNLAMRFDDKIPPLPHKINYSFHLEADFYLKSALMIGAYQTDPSKPDKTHLTSACKPVLTGKSIKGALRHRATTILNTLGLTADDILKDMMGWVDNEKNKENDARKSRLRLEEVILDGVMPMKQDRIRIDRFTGGTMSGALFESEPVWRNDDKTFRLNFTLKAPVEADPARDGKYRCEKALLLHLLKDLWTGDLAIGGEKNIGRGVFRGQRAKIFENGKPIADFLENKDTGALDFIIGSPVELNRTYYLNQPVL